MPRSCRRRRATGVCPIGQLSQSVHGEDLIADPASPDHFSYPPPIVTPPARESTVASRSRHGRVFHTEIAAPHVPASMHGACDMRAPPPARAGHGSVNSKRSRAKKTSVRPVSTLVDAPCARAGPSGSGRVPRSHIFIIFTRRPLCVQKSGEMSADVRISIRSEPIAPPGRGLFT